MDKQIQGMFEAINKRITSLEMQLSPLIMRANRGVDENGEGLIDVADLADENDSSIEELAEMLSELDERVQTLEEKEE